MTVPRALLEEMDLPVEAIAARVGLISAVNLCRRFRAQAGTTPGAYRRAFRARRDLALYYLTAGVVWRLRRLRWVMETSMLKTLALKDRSAVSKMARKYRTAIDTRHGKRRCFEAHVEREGKTPLVARSGGIPLKRQKTAVVLDPSSGPGRRPR